MIRVNSSEEWDDYWQENESPDLWIRLYSRIANFYRTFLIEPRLRRVLSAEFPHGSRLLHAGSGAGEVDRKVRSIFEIIAVDISPKALSSYSENYPNSKTIVCDITNLEELKTSVAKPIHGVYNLGVMEHLTFAQIRESLNNFSRIVGSGGKIVLFIPPTFGSSVIFLNFVHKLFDLFGYPGKRLHPDEPSKVSTAHRFRKNFLVDEDLFLASFRLSLFDLFTYVVVVIEVK